MSMELEMLKLNLRITHTKDDEYLTKLLASVTKELDGKGISLAGADFSNDVDLLFLLTDYAAWRYRSRIQDTPMPYNLIIRLRDAKVKARVNYVEANESEVIE